MDNIDKPGDSSPAQTEAAETETLQAFADASTPNQSDSHPDLNEALDTVDGLESLRASGGLNKKRKTTSQCQICSCNLKNEKPYYQRYRICPTCSAIDRTDDVDGTLKRFCQQCGKFQAITLFDGSMRTCRERLDRHAARRRKSHARQAAIRRGSPVDDYEPAAASPHDGYPSSLGPQRRQYTQPVRYQMQPVHPYQRPPPYQQPLSNPMLELAQQILQQPPSVQRSWAEQQQQQQIQQHQQQQMMEQLMASITAARPSPSNLLNHLYQPTPLRFSPSPHPQSYTDPPAIDPTAAAVKLKAVLVLLLNEAAASAAAAAPPPPQPPPPPPPPQPPQPPQNEALQSMLQRLVDIASAGGNGAGPSAPASPTVSAIPATNTNATAAGTGTEVAAGASSLPSEIAGLAPQLRAALAALLKQEQE